jgi:hypothetical protein
MFGRNKNRPVSGSIDTLVAKQTRIEGDVAFQGGVNKHITGLVNRVHLGLLAQENHPVLKTQLIGF